MMYIESKSNKTIKHLARLAREKKYRKTCGEIFCEGEKMLAEAMKSNITIKTVLIRENATGFAQELADNAQREGAQVFCARDDVFELASDVKTPQSVIFSCLPPEMSDKALSGIDCGVMLDGIQDPGNMGTILRTADAFKVGAVVLVNGCTDPYSPKVIRATMGAIFRLPVFFMDIDVAIDTFKKKGMKVYVAALTQNALPIGDVDMNNSVIIIGNEGNGASDIALEQADNAVILPMQGNAESLNAGVAAAIFIWEMQK